MVMTPTIQAFVLNGSKKHLPSITKSWNFRRHNLKVASHQWKKLHLDVGKCLRLLLILRLFMTSMWLLQPFFITCSAAARYNFHVYPTVHDVDEFPCLTTCWFLVGNGGMHPSSRPCLISNNTLKALFSIPSFPSKNQKLSLRRLPVRLRLQGLKALAQGTESLGGLPPKLAGQIVLTL